MFAGTHIAHLTERIFFYGLRAIKMLLLRSTEKLSQAQIGNLRAELLLAHGPDRILSPYDQHSLRDRRRCH